LYDLKGQGYLVNVIKPLENTIREHVLLQRAFKDLKIDLKEKLVEKPYIVKRVDNIAFDSLKKYNGTTNEIVRIKHDLKWFYYIGSTIENSRPICDHLRDLGNRAISTDELKKILDDFCPNGNPSTEKITYVTVNNVSVTLPKGSGMKPGTTVANFPDNTGGYKCRHDVKFTRYPNGIN